MKIHAVFGAAVVAAMLAGCQNQTPADVYGLPADSELVASVGDVQARNAVIRQHALFEHHFRVDSPALNDLGRRSLRILAAGFSAGGGAVNVSRGGAGERLYNARVQAVINAFGECGVPAERLRVSDDMAGGDGMPSERVVKILTQQSPAAAGGATAAPTPITTGGD